jgi:predicted RNA polymerase sigma factor
MHFCCNQRRWHSAYPAPKRKSATPIPYRVPQADERPARIGTVLAVLYLIFNEGYTSSCGDEVRRIELCDEAIRLGRLLANLMPQESEVLGLLAMIRPMRYPLIAMR